MKNRVFNANSHFLIDGVPAGIKYSLMHRTTNSVNSTIQRAWLLNSQSCFLPLFDDHRLQIVPLLVLGLDLLDDGR